MYDSTYGSSEYSFMTMKTLRLRHTIFVTYAKEIFLSTAIIVIKTLIKQSMHVNDDKIVVYTRSLQSEHEESEQKSSVRVQPTGAWNLLRSRVLVRRPCPWKSIQSLRSKRRGRS